MSRKFLSETLTWWHRGNMNQKILSRILGYEKAVDSIGHWPDFHDAECLDGASEN